MKIEALLNRDSQNEESFLKRYGFKLLSSVMIVVLNTVSQIIFARAVGPESYGYFNYNLNLFTTAMSLINVSSSDAFYTKISKRRHEKDLIQFYFIYALFLFCVINVLFAFIYVSGISKQVWGNQTVINLLLGLYVTYLVYLTNVFTCLSDAFSETKYTEFGKLIQKIIVCVLTVAFFILSEITQTRFYLFQIISMIIVIVIFSIIF